MFAKDSSRAIEGLLKIDEIAKLLSLSRRTVQRMVSAGEFPKPVKLRRSVRWRPSDIEMYLRRKNGGV